MNKARLEAFSDGVFAIIITIMVLEIKVPHGENLVALKPLIPVMLSYMLSFAYVGIYWVNHHHLLHTAKKVNAGILWSNLFLLFWLSLVPVATEWMGETNFHAYPVAAYALLLLLSGSAFYVLSMHIQKKNEFSKEMISVFDGLKRKSVYSIIAYIAALILAFINTTISEVLFFLVAASWFIPDKKIELALGGD